MAKNKPADQKKAEPLMTRDELARLFRVNPGTIANWASREGLPTAEGGGGGRQAKYLPSACVAWRLAVIEGRESSDGLNEKLERARKDKSIREWTELRTAEKRKLVIARDQAEREGQGLAIAVKAKVLALARRMVQAGILPSDRQADAEKLCREACSDMARWTTADVATVVAMEHRA